MSAEDTVIRVVKEVSPGTTPANDTGWKELPITGETLGFAPTVGADDSIIADGMARAAPIQDMVYSGGINANLIAGFYDEFLESVFSSTWQTDVLKMGVAHQYLSIEKEYKYLSSGNNFQVFKGNRVNTFNVGFTYPGNVSLSFDLLGEGSTEDATSIVGTGSSAAVGEYDIIDSAEGVTSIEIGGSAAPADVIVRGYNLNIARNLRAVTGAGAPIGPKDVPRGTQFVVTGDIEMYHSESSQLYYEQLKNGTFYDLAITFSDGTKTYKFDVPKARLTGGGNPNATGANTDNMLSLPFSALYDATSSSVVTLTRT